MAIAWFPNILFFSFSIALKFKFAAKVYKIIIPCNIESSIYGPTVISSSNLDDAIVHAVDHGAKIINISIIFDTSYGNMQAVVNAIEYAYSNGVTIFTGSGNTGSSSLGFPASYSKVIAVGSISQYDVRSTFSAYGSNLSLVAKALNISRPTEVCTIKVSSASCDKTDSGISERLSLTRIGA